MDNIERDVRDLSFEGIGTEWVPIFHIQLLYYIVVIFIHHIIIISNYNILWEYPQIGLDDDEWLPRFWALGSSVADVLVS